jgi:hypothetical protein
MREGMVVRRMKERRVGEEGREIPLRFSIFENHSLQFPKVYFPDTGALGLSSCLPSDTNVESLPLIKRYLQVSYPRPGPLISFSEMVDY